VTDRHAGYVVTLAADVREDDADEIITALRMVRGVASVDPVTSDPINQQIATTRQDVIWTQELYALIRGIREPE
jgi:hypothetical protein